MQATANNLWFVVLSASEHSSKSTFNFFSYSVHRQTQREIETLMDIRTKNIIAYNEVVGAIILRLITEQQQQLRRTADCS